MPNTYTQIYYHLIWATKERAPLLTPVVQQAVYRFIHVRRGEMGVEVHALGGVEDHVHLVVSIPPRLSVADFMHQIKGASSHYINTRGEEDRLYWQPGYGALTFAKRDLPRVTAYVADQRRHHQEGSLSVEMERLDPESAST